MRARRADRASILHESEQAVFVMGRIRGLGLLRLEGRGAAVVEIAFGVSPALRSS
jgi:hypothetical protein